MNEDYVSFEVATLLKEKGFEFTINKGVVDYGKSVKEEVSFYQRPTLYMAQKWLREVHDFHIAIDLNSRKLYYYRIYDLRENEFISQSEGYFKTYEESLQAAIFETTEYI